MTAPNSVIETRSKHMVGVEAEWADSWKCFIRPPQPDGSIRETDDGSSELYENLLIMSVEFTCVGVTGHCEGRRPRRFCMCVHVHVRTSMSV